MYDEILLPTDGSSGTVRALEHAIAVAGDQAAAIHVLHVVDRRLYLAASDESKEEVRRSLQEAADRAIEDAGVRLEESGIDYRTEIREGIPHRTITEYAGEEGIDLVVMGTHGQAGQEQRVALGSTTERVLEDADVPVLVVDID